MNKIKSLLAVAAATAVISSPINAAVVDEVGSKAVTSIGNQVNGMQNVSYFRVNPGWQQAPCAFGVMYFDPTTPMGKTFLATLLTAKASGTNLSRVVYDATVDGSGNTICTLDQIIELE